MYASLYSQKLRVWRYIVYHVVDADVSGPYSNAMERQTVCLD